MRRKPDKQKAALKVALKDLVEKLEQIKANKDYHNMITLFEIHGYQYNGPNWEMELRRAKHALQNKR
jgi:hypothetical protein